MEKNLKKNIYAYICVFLCIYNQIILLYTGNLTDQLSSVIQSCPTLWPHELQHTRPPCPSPTPGVHPTWCQIYMNICLVFIISTVIYKTFKNCWVIFLTCKALLFVIYGKHKYCPVLLLLLMVLSMRSVMSDTTLNMKSVFLV